MNENSENAAGREDPASGIDRKATKAIPQPSATDKSPLVEIGERAHRMARNAAILWRNQAPKSGADWPAFRGVLRLAGGEKFWAGVWMRTVKGVPVLELRLTPKQEDS